MRLLRIVAKLSQRLCSDLSSASLSVRAHVHLICHLRLHCEVVHKVGVGLALTRIRLCTIVLQKATVNVLATS